MHAKKWLKGLVVVIGPLKVEGNKQLSRNFYDHSIGELQRPLSETMYSIIGNECLSTMAFIEVTQIFVESR